MPVRFYAGKISTSSPLRDKSLQFRRMKVLAVSDIEIFDKTVEVDLNGLSSHLPSVDVILSCGDIHPKVFDLIRAKTSSPIFGVAGNHDGVLPAEVINLHFKIKQFGEIKLGGFGGAWRYKENGRNLYSDEEVRTLLSFFPEVDVFVAHNPMEGVNEIDDGVHNGFSAFTDYCRRKSVPLFLHGHSGLEAEERVENTLVVGVNGFKLMDFEVG